jgi:hypothetical protein
MVEKTTVYLPPSQLDRLHEVHQTTTQFPDRTALWRTVDRALDVLEEEEGMTEETR